MTPHDHVIEVLRRVNPVPLSSVANEGVSGNLPDLGVYRERTAAMSNDLLTEPRNASTSVSGWPKLVGALAVMVVVVAVAFILDRNEPVEVADSVSAPHSSVIAAVLDAVDSSDAAAFGEVFAPGGRFTSYLDFEARASCCGSYAADESQLVGAWMAVNETWGLDLDLVTCETVTDTTVRCDMTSAWETLRMEIGENWAFVFDENDALVSLVMVVIDWDPDGRSQPLGYAGIVEGWREWLSDERPTDAGRLLPIPPPETVINGVSYQSNLFPYDPSLASEITDSIDEYLATQ